MMLIFPQGLWTSPLNYCIMFYRECLFSSFMLYKVIRGGYYYYSRITVWRSAIICNNNYYGFTNTYHNKSQVWSRISAVMRNLKTKCLNSKSAGLGNSKGFFMQHIIIAQHHSKSVLGIKLINEEIFNRRKLSPIEFFVT